ncbi:MAG: hypothetical protein P1V20_04555, partial [Verrucomicrobiales bacterium]|nr:hypothetical protein [Verrucomicrobiales bacterium]
MSESPDLPPALPSSKSNGSLSVTLAWLVIIASVAFLAWTANQPLEESETVEEEGLIPIEEANELAMMKIQSRFIIGVAQFNRAEAVRSVKQLEEMASTNRGMVAVALVHNFIDPENGRSKGLEILSDLEPKTPAELVLKNRVELALKNGGGESEIAEMKKYLGWFSHLLPAAGNGSENTASAEKIRSEAINSMMIFGGFFVLVILAFLAGVILLILFFVSIANQKARLHFDATD